MGLGGFGGFGWVWVGLGGFGGVWGGLGGFEGVGVWGGLGGFGGFWGVLGGGFLGDFGWNGKGYRAVSLSETTEVAIVSMETTT